MPSITTMLLGFLPAVLAVGAGVDSGSPALRPQVWVGTGAMTNMTVFGTDMTDLVHQVRRYDPAVDVAGVVAGAKLMARDSGSPEDLPDPGVPGNLWQGPGGPHGYGGDMVVYDYMCGNWATADEYRTRYGASQLRNMGAQRAVTRANTCQRHWCRDTTAMFVCNGQDTDLSIPYYNIGWMADRLDRLCCDDNGGKSGQMWHYNGGYSVVLGYANCREDATTNQPYPYGLGNNPHCLDASHGHGPPKE